MTAPVSRTGATDREVEAVTELRRLVAEYQRVEKDRPGRDPWDFTVAGLKLARAAAKHLPALLAEQPGGGR